MLSGRNIENGRINFDDFRLISHEDFATEDARTRVSVNDVLLTIVGTIGRSAVVGSDQKRFTLQRSVAVIRPTGIDSKFLSLQFQAPAAQRFFAENAKGTAQKGVYLKTLAVTPIQLPPLAEQKRIVAKIEELFSALEAGEESLRVARRQLGVYRQSLLKQAFEGKLTEKWRTQNPAKLESPAQILARIQSARESRFEEALKEWETAVRDWEKTGASGRKPSKPSEPDTHTSGSTTLADGLPSLPRGWCWVALEHVVTSGPTNGYSPTSVSFPTSTKAITLTATTSGRFDGSHFKYIDEVFPPTSDLWLRDGDILIQRGNTLEYVGVPALYRGPPNQFIYPDLMMRLRLPDCILPEFLTLAISDKRARNFMRARAVGAAGSMPKINHATVRALPVPLCSLPEQQEIVRLLDAQFEVIDQNEREIDAALKRSEALRQAILKKAFTGRLVPQIATDEPAPALLARLRAASKSFETQPSRPAPAAKSFPSPRAPADDLFPEVVAFKPLGKTDLQAGIVALTFDCFTRRGQFCGHTIAEKVVHFADHLADLELDRHAVKDAAGPNDYKRAKEIEHRARMKGWFTVTHDGPVYHYHAGRNLPALLDATRRTIGARLTRIEKLLEALRGFDTREIEVCATVFAAWNNLLLRHVPISDAAIVTEARENWHERKLKIDRALFFAAIAWLRQHDFVPKGTGQLVERPAAARS